MVFIYFGIVSMRNFYFIALWVVRTIENIDFQPFYMSERSLKKSINAINFYGYSYVTFQIPLIRRPICLIYLKLIKLFCRDFVLRLNAYVLRRGTDPSFSG